MKKKNHQLSFTVLGILMILAMGFLVHPVTTQAATAQTKAKALKAYKQYVSESDFQYFRMFDVNKDGLKELLISRDYNPSQKTSSTVNVYTYSGGTSHVFTMVAQL